MFKWLKRQNIQSELSPVLHLLKNEYGLRWLFEPTDCSFECGSLALPILQQLESDGLVTESESCFFTGWDEIYLILNHPEYSQVCPDILIPELVLLTPALESIGTLIDIDFGVTICGWTNLEGVPVKIDIVIGPIISIDGKLGLIPAPSWNVLKLVNAFWQRPADEHNDINNRKLWGQIRQTAIAAKSQLSDFLFR